MQKLNPALAKALRFVIPGVILFFLGNVLYSQWQLLEEHEWSFDPLYFVLSFLFLLITLFFYSLLWQKVFQQIGVKMPLSKVFKIFHLSNLGRYLPGRIWQFVGMFYMLERENVGKMKATMGILWANIFVNLSGMLIGLITVWYTNFNLTFPSFIALVTIFVLVVIFIQPKVMERVLNYILKTLKREEEIEISFSFTKILFFLLIYSLLWVCLGFGLFLFARSITDVSISLLPLFIGIFASSYVIGYLAFFSPGGIGVREGVLSYLLSFYLPIPVATLIALLARIWMTSAELVCATVALRIK